MKILEQAFSKINPIHKKQKDFFIFLVQGLIGSAGKKTFRNLARYMQLTEHTFLRQMSKTFDFIGLNTALIQESKNDDEVLIAAQDSSFIPKSGKATHGLDYFWNGCAGKAEKGLEVDVIAVIKINNSSKDGYSISAEQTPANKLSKNERKKHKNGPTKIDFYLDHVKKVASKLFSLDIKYMTVDAFCAKEKYVNGVVALGLHVISKMRKDARLFRIYTGPQKARGRKKKIDNSRVNLEDFQNSSVIKVNNENVEIRSCIAHSVSLKRLVKVVLVKKFMTGNKFGEAVLFSTDVNLDPALIYQFYIARFQIEFVFRDAKGFTGFTDCQSRSAQRLHYHFNASLTALNVAKIQDRLLQKKEGVQHAFSMTSWTRKYHVEIVINRFISMFGFDQSLVKLHPNYESLLSFGTIKH